MDLSNYLQLTSGGVLPFDKRRSAVGFESTDLGERSIERREFGSGEDELESDLAGALAILLTLGVAGVVLLGRVSDKPVLSNTQILDFHNRTSPSITT